MAIVSQLHQCFLFNCMTKHNMFACTFQENINFDTMVKLSQVLEQWSNDEEVSSLKNSSTQVHDRVHEKGTISENHEIYVLADENGECNRLSWKCDDAIHCVPAWHVCDATPDCPDKSDEVGCPQDNPQTAAAPEVSSKIRSRYLLNFRLNCMFWTLLAKVSRRRRKK